VPLGFAAAMPSGFCSHSPKKMAKSPAIHSSGPAKSFYTYSIQGMLHFFDPQIW
jgi:hypothetical protein